MMRSVGKFSTRKRDTDAKNHHTLVIRQSSLGETHRSMWMAVVSQKEQGTHMPLKNAKQILLKAQERW